MTKTIFFPWAVVFLCTVCNAQFFYNDDQQPAFQEPADQDNGQGYGNPNTVVQPSQHSEPVNYQSAPPAAVPEYQPRPPSNRARIRQPKIVELQPPAARVYSPSVFENLALGMPPAGVSIPADSFLNVLRNDGGGYAHTRQNPVQEQPPPQRTTFVQPPPPQRSTFVQSPPPQRPTFAQSPPPQRTAFVQSPPAQSFHAPPIETLQYSNEPALPQRAERPRVVAPHNPQVDKLQTDPIQNPEQYQAPAQVPVQQRSTRRRSGTRHRQTTSYQPPWRIQEPEERVYSPSVFENLALGVAPQGISVPEDSLLNILRSDRPVRSRRNEAYQTSLPAAPPVQMYAPSSPIQVESTDYDPLQEIPNVQPEPRRVNPQPPPNIQPVQRRVHQQPPQEIQNVQTVPRRVNRPPPQPVQPIQNVQTVSRRANRPPPQPRPQPEFVENEPTHEVFEEQPQVVQQPKPVTKRKRVTVRRHRQSSGTRDLNEEEEFNQPPKQYAPSIFENVGLGEAPPGIYYPEDSFLNLLRGDAPAIRPVQQPARQRSHVQQEAAPQPNAPDITRTQDYDGSDYNNQQDSYVRQNRRSRPLNQPAPQQYEPEYRRPAPQEIPRPAVAPTPISPPRRQRQPSRSQPISVPQQQQVSEVVYNAVPEPQEVDDIQRYRSQNSNQRSPEQRQVPQRRRVDPAPRYIPPPEPVYEAPQPSYNDDSSYQEGDILRRRPQSRNQRTQVQQSAPPQRAESRRPQQQYTSNDQAPQTREQSRYRPAKLSVKPLPDDVDGDQIPGEAGIDYPTFHVIPKTSFSCGQQAHNGYYADLDTSCQVVHMCQAGGVQSSFLCPNGTIFNQEKFSCQWWYKVNCADAPSHYGVNDKLYKVPPQPERRRSEE